MLFPSFSNRLELRAWLQSVPEDRAREYCRWVLENRKKTKKIIYAPTQVELKSLPEFPNINYYNALFGSYHQLCNELGLICKHRADFVPFNEVSKYDKIVIIDSREKAPIGFPKGIKTEVRGLKFGDYALDGNSPIILERKSLSDLIGTLSRNQERFENELVRAEEADAHLVIIVEAGFGCALEFDKLPWITKFTRAKPSFIWHKIRDIIQKFPNVQFLFVAGGRSEVARVGLKLLYNGNEFRSYDLQMLSEKGIL